MTAPSIQFDAEDFTAADVAAFAGDSWWRYRAAIQTGVIADDSVRDQAISVIFSVMDDLREVAQALRDTSRVREIETINVCAAQMSRLVVELASEIQALTHEAEVLMIERTPPKPDAQVVR